MNERMTGSRGCSISNQRYTKAWGGGVRRSLPVYMLEVKPGQKYTGGQKERTSRVNIRGSASKE